MGKNYNILEAFTASHLQTEDVKSWRLKQPTRRHKSHELFFIITAVNKPNNDAILLMNITTHLGHIYILCVCMCIKRNKLGTNNHNTVKSALNKSIYVHKTLTAEWEKLSV